MGQKCPKTAHVKCGVPFLQIVFKIINLWILTLCLFDWFFNLDFFSYSIGLKLCIDCIAQKKTKIYITTMLVTLLIKHSI